MKIVETIAEVREQVKQWRKEGLTVGLVPTMGYLHEGHKSLIDRAVAENDRVVVSVFVNPMQFRHQRIWKAIHVIWIVMQHFVKKQVQALFSIRIQAKCTTRIFLLLLI